MDFKNGRFDIISYRGPIIVRHECNEQYTDKNGVVAKCDGQCPDHGMDYNTAADIVIKWHREQVKQLLAKKQPKRVKRVEPKDNGDTTKPTPTRRRRLRSKATTT